MKRVAPLLALIALAAGPALARKKQAPLPAPTPTPLPASIDGLPIGELPKQELAPGACAAFLWAQTPSHALIAMLSANPALIRYAPGGVVTDLARTSAEGDARYGLMPQSSYAGGDTTVSADLTIVERADIQNGAAITSGTLSIGKAGGDTVVVPIVGLIGCG